MCVCVCVYIYIYIYIYILFPNIHSMLENRVVSEINVLWPCVLQGFHTEDNQPLGYKKLKVSSAIEGQIF